MNTVGTLDAHVCCYMVRNCVRKITFSN